MKIYSFLLFIALSTSPALFSVEPYMVILMNQGNTSAEHQSIRSLVNAGKDFFKKINFGIDLRLPGWIPTADNAKKQRTEEIIEKFEAHDKKSEASTKFQGSNHGI